MLLAQKLLAMPQSSAPIEYVGSVTGSYNRSQNWDESGEALDVLSVASEGDLVVIALTFDGSPAAVSWEGMAFTAIEDKTADLGYYLGYRSVQAGDANPYLNIGSGKWTGTSVVAAVFSNVGSYGSKASTTGGSGLPNPPNLTASGDLWIASGHLTGDTVTDFSAPSGYTLADQETGSYLVKKSSTVLAYKIDSLSSDDPGAFTGTGSGPWAGITGAFSK